MTLFITVYPFFNPLEANSGVWAGAGRSAGVESPSFLPLTLAQRNTATSGSGFDNVSKPHDIRYAEAQYKLVADLATGATTSKQALINFFSAINTADRIFLNDAPSASVLSAQEGWVKGLGIDSISLKVQLQDSIIARLNDPNDGLADYLGNQFSQGEMQSLKGLMDTYTANPTETNMQNVLNAIGGSDLIERLQISDIVEYGLVGDVGILGEVVAKLPALLAFGAGQQAQSFSDAVNADAQVDIGGTSFQLGEVLESIYEGGVAVAQFIAGQAEAAVSWLTDGDNQLTISQWLAANVGDLIDGEISADEAFISLARYMGEAKIAGFVASAVNTVFEAKDALEDVFEFLGVTGTTQSGADITGLYVDSVYGALARIGVDFALSGFDTEQATKAGAATISGAITATYLKDVLGWNSSAVSASTAAVTTAIQGLLNSGDFDTSDWAMLGVQVGIAAGSAAGGAAIATAILGNPAVYTTPYTAVAAVAAAVIAYISGNLVGSIYRGKVFNEGEFANAQQLLNSIYQIQQIEVNGQLVNALVAVHPQGSTIIAQDISYILGNVGSDVLVGNNSAGTISAAAGADYLEARAGDDNLLGGDGNDHLNGGDGNDIIQGDSGDDIVLGEEGTDTLIGGVGNDFMHAGSGDDIIAGGDGNDYIIAGGGIDAISGDAGNDTIDGGYGDDGIAGGEGNDLILGNLGNDAINGDAGDDTIFGAEDNDEIFGGEGNDFIDGGEGIDILHGDAGRDLIVGGEGDDFADGGLADDDILGGTGNDVLLGGLDDDYLAGEAGDDSISGGFGNDILVGGIGANSLDGGAGSDVYAVGADTSEQNNIIIDVGSEEDADTLLLSWLSQANALSNLTLLKDENDLVISHNGRILATVTDQFAITGNGLESIELSEGNYINLSAVSYNPTTNLGSFIVQSPLGVSVAGAVALRQSMIDENLLGQNLYWNDTFLDKLSQLAYDEQLSDQTVYTYYDGTQVESFKRARSKFGGNYTVYRLGEVNNNISGTEFVRLEYAILDAEDQAAAANFGNSEAALAGPYESFINGATVVYSTINGKNIQDIVVNGAVISTRVAGESTLYTAGQVVYGATYAQRLAAGTTATTDIAVKKQGGDLLVSDRGNDYLDGKSGDDALVGNDGNDTIIGGDGNDWGFGGDGNDSVLGGSGDDVLFGGAGNDTIAGGAHNDAIMGGGGSDVIAGDSGDDWIDGGDENDTISSGDGDDVVLGGAGNDILQGGAGNDVIQGGDGDDNLVGDDGNDTLIGGIGRDTLNGGAGEDRVVFESTDGDITFDFQSGTYQVGSSGIVSIVNIEQVASSSYNDLIYSGAGANYIDGGAGVDTVSYIHSTAGVNVNLTTGVNSGAYAEGDTLRNIESLIGSAHNDQLSGNSVANVLLGMAGNDTLIGGIGADFIDGGDGIDVVSYSNSVNAVNINLGAFTFSGGDAQGDYLTNVEYVLGSWRNDTIIGNAINNLLQGGYGNDSLNGSAGDDTLVGGLGADTLDGGDGIDMVSYFGSAAVSVNLGTGAVSAGDAAGDVLSNIENIQGSDYNDNIVGNALANLVYGINGNDSINGGGGNDTLYGMDGNDSILGADGHDYMFGDAGADTIYGGIGNDTSFGGAENDVLYGDDGDDLIIGVDGNDTLYGGIGRDELLGDVGNDLLDGGEDDDELGGGAGNDTISGGTGNDIIFADDTFLENPSSGSDVVYGGDGNDYVRGGGGNDNLDGGVGNDTILGDDGDDVITDLFGNNTINAGAGNDLITGGSGKDNVLGYEGDDTIHGAGDDDKLYGLSGNDSVTGGIGNDIIYGDSGNDVLLGNEGNDLIDGWYGTDTIDGGDGNDTIVGGDHNDVLSGGIGADVIYGDRSDAISIPNDANQILDLITNKPTFDTWGLLYSGDQYTLNGLQQATHDMLIINPAKYSDNGREVLWEADDLAFIKSGAVDQLFGYVSTSKINTYITQWNTDWTVDGTATGALTTQGQAVTWLGAVDTAFAGTREANYWDSSWHDVIFERIDMMIQQGFNGTLLDDVGEFYSRGVTFVNGVPATQLDRDKILSNAVAMRDLIIAIREHADISMAAKMGIAVNQLTNDTRFQLYVNGAPYVITDALGFNTFAEALAVPATQNYLNAIDGILAENLFSLNDPAIPDIAAIYGTHGVTMLSIDTDQVTEQQRLQIIADAVNAGFVPYATESSLYEVLNDPFLSEVINAAAPVGGDDSITGGDGNDTLLGGDGNDTLLGGLGADSLNGQNGLDSVSYEGSNAAIVINLSTGAVSGGHAQGDILLNIEGVIGSSLNDSITGSNADNVLNGGSGNDTMVGGFGNDTYNVNATGDVVTENLNEGTDTIISSITYTLGANLENLVLSGTTAVNGTGNTLNNVLTGNSAANILTGGVGNDTMAGGLGNDTYYVDVAGDVITENLNEGTDTVSSSVTYSLAANLETLTLTGAAAINGTGNTLSNTLTGNSAANILNGGDGNDTINGGSGNDTMDGGTGNDRMVGSLGDDSYAVDATGDVVTENLNEGIDTVNSSITYTLGANLENLILSGTAAINGTGNTFNNILTGNSAVNILNGGVGNDTMAGGLGNDTYFVDAIGDVVTENLNEGIDTVNSSITLTLGANLDNIILSGTTAINGTGNTLSNMLTGNSAANILTGGDGNDTMNGGAGNDSMIGGLGDDSYTVDVAGDVITENLNEGIDTVSSGITYILGANLENLILTGALAINGTGNGLHNALAGNSAANILTGGDGNDSINGGAGNDTMIGGLGDDSYTVDAAGDVITENLNEGIDTVSSSRTYILGTNLEHLTLTGALVINGTGNAFNNILTGNSAANILTGAAGNDTMDGGAGNDTMIGGLGDDSYTVDASGDVVTENLNEGIDTVNSAVTFTLGTNLENLILTGTLAINGTGNAFNNVLTGNNAANILTGGDGNDSIYGGIGNDLIIGGMDSDYLDGGDGVDTVSYLTSAAFVSIDLAANSFWSGEASWDLIVNVENVIGSNYNDWIVGNALDNALTGGLGLDALTGGAGNDTLDAGAGDDQLIGGEGDDLLIGGAGSDLLDGGNGIDTVSYAGSSLWVNVDLANNNQWNGDASWDNITNVENVTGSAYADNISGNSGANLLTGDAGDDTLFGGDGNDTIYGGIGNDLIIGGIGSDYLDGGDGVDTVSYLTSAAFVSIDFAANSFWSGEASWDLIVNVENVIGSNHNDWIVGNALDNVLTGGFGLDALTGGAGNDTLDAGAGDDQLIGGDGDDLLIGGAGSDLLDGGNGIDTVSYAGSSLWVNVDLANNNQWNGDASWDNITNVENVTGSAYADNISGNSGANLLKGGAGVDTLYGLGGNDIIHGDDDGDIIIGGSGRDELWGGAGADVFKVLSLSDSQTGNADTIMDFTQGVDKIDVTGLGFTGLENTGTPSFGKLGTYLADGWTHLTDGEDFDIAILGSHTLTQADLINT